eukprot:11181023-Lingulodinium_polyedra.AAC.1
MERANVQVATRGVGRRSIRTHLRNSSQTLQTDAVKSTARNCNGSQIARSRAPRARPFCGARTECGTCRA